MPGIKRNVFPHEIVDISLSVISVISGGQKEGRRRRRRRKRKGSEKKRRSPAIPCRCCKKIKSTPASFWFGNEDPCHVKQILGRYSKELIADRAPNSRAPEEFVGRVKRSIIETDSGFETFDEVQVFQREVVPLGVMQNLVKTITFRTTWDLEDGFPITLREIPSGEKEKVVRHLVSSASPSYLYALPVEHDDSEYEYSCRSEAREVSYASGFSHCVYESFLQLGRSIPPCKDLDCSGFQDDAKLAKLDFDKQCCDKDLYDAYDEKKNDDDEKKDDADDDSPILDWYSDEDCNSSPKEKESKPIDYQDIEAYLADINRSRSYNGLDSFLE